MQKTLHRLETHRLVGNDGQTYLVHGYEHLTRLDHMPDLADQWQSTGLFEYKLADGTPLQVAADGSMTIPRSGVQLSGVPADARLPSAGRRAPVMPSHSPPAA